MTRQSRILLAAAAAVSVVVAGAVLLFGYNSPPQFPSLYEPGAPTVDGHVAYVEYGREDCVWVLDVANGESEELYCDAWVWPEGWDADGNLVVHTGDGQDQMWVVDPNTGDVLGAGDFEALPPSSRGSLRSRSNEGRATLTYGSGEDEVTLIDVEAPRNYNFLSYGITANKTYAWVCDSEDRLLIVPLDGSDGPWLVGGGVGDPLWYG